MLLFVLFVPTIFAAALGSRIHSSQISNPIKITAEEALDTKRGEIIENNCIIKGENELCMEDIPDLVRAKLQGKLNCVGTDLMGNNSINLISRNSFVLDHNCELCIHTNSLQYSPTVMKTGDKKMYVVQTNKIEQRFNIQLCQPDSVQQNSVCVKAQKERNISSGTVTACKQKYSEITILLYDADKDVLVPKKIRYPTACVCVIEEPSE